MTNEQNNPQFYTPNSLGESLPLPKEIINTIEFPKSSVIKARNRQYQTLPVNSFIIDGVPGVPFEKGASNPDVFFQGEDIVYDAFLIYDGLPVNTEDYDVHVLVKTSPRAGEATWEGKLDSGVFVDTEYPGRFEIWIPASFTETWMAGTYYLTILITERVGAGKGRFDRKYVIMQTYLNIDYSNFSPNPETASPTHPGVAERGLLEPTWPNKPNTIGSQITTGPRLSSMPAQKGLDPTEIQ